MHSGNGIQTTGITVNGAAAINALTGGFPRTLAALPPGANTGRADLFLFADNYQRPYVQQGRLGYEREVFGSTSISATYLFYKGVHLSRTRDINLFAPVSANAVFGSQTFTVARFPAAGATPAVHPQRLQPLQPLEHRDRQRQPVRRLLVERHDADAHVHRPRAQRALRRTAHLHQLARASTRRQARLLKSGSRNKNGVTLDKSITPFLF